MKKMLLGALVASCIVSSTSVMASTQSSSGYNTYTNSKYGFTLMIPNDWKGLYEVKSFSPQGGGQTIQVINFDYIKEKGHPFILNLDVYPKSILSHLKSDPTAVKVFSNNKYVFAFYKQNEYLSNSKNYAEFKHLESEIPAIVASFKTRVV